MNKKYIAIDFEYRDGDKARLTPVCCALSDGNSIEKYWLFDGSDTESLKSRLASIKATHVLVAHAVELAEARCLYTMGIDASTYDWWDTMLVEHILTNSTELATTCSVGEFEETQAEAHQKSLSLLSTLRRHKIHAEDSALKDAMRKLILTAENLDTHREKILNYCASDVSDLLTLQESQLRKYDSILNDDNNIHLFRDTDNNAESSAIRFSWQAAEFAKIDFRGIPVKADEFEMFLSKASNLIGKLKEEFNTKFDIYEPKSKKDPTLKETRSKVQDRIKSVIESQKITGWPLSDKTGLLKTDNDTLEEFESLDEFVSEYRQHRKLLKAFNGLATGWGSSYCKGRIYPYHGTGLTATFRNAHKGKSGFIPAWSKVLRTLMHAPEGYSLLAIDFKSQETILMADFMNDSAMQQSYESGDFYVATAQKMGLLPVPYDAHGTYNGMQQKAIRNKVIKPMVLGLQYGMGAEKLSMRLGIPVDKTEKLITSYKNTYKNVYDGRFKLGKMIEKSSPWLIFPDGTALHTLAPNNGKTRSMNTCLNYPIQGGGAYILHRIIEGCAKQGIKLIATVHDEVIAQVKNSHIGKVTETLSLIMKEAYSELTGTNNVKVEPEVWGGTVRCDHLENNNETYFRLLELVKSV